MPLIPGFFSLVSVDHFQWRALSEREVLLYKKVCPAGDYRAGQVMILDTFSFSQAVRTGRAIVEDTVTER